MSEEGVGCHESFFWENQSWGFTNSDNSAGGSEEKLGNKKVPGSSSNSQAEIGMEEAVPLPIVKKKGRGGVTKNGKGSNGEAGRAGKGSGESDHDVHIWTERERRKKMRNMFANLHALLPQLPPKADKSTIVDEAVNCIQTLQHTLQKLQKQKQERLQGASSTFGFEPNTITSSQKLSYDTREAFLADQGSSNIQAIGTTTTCSNSLPVLRNPIMFQTWTSSNVVLNICGNDAQISVCSPKKPGLLTTICYVMEKHKIEVVSAQLTSDYDRTMYMIQAHVTGASVQFQEAAFPVEDIYKQAVAEIMLWVSS